MTGGRRQEALASAVSEKDAHLALLEVAGIRDGRTAEQADSLASQKQKLVQRMRQEVSHLSIIKRWTLHVMTSQRTDPSFCPIRTSSPLPVTPFLRFISWWTSSIGYKADLESSPSKKKGGGSRWLEECVPVASCTPVRFFL